MSKLSVFVGSSSQGIEDARAIQAQLSDESAEVGLWNEAVFPLGFGTLESHLSGSSHQRVAPGRCQ
jgi:predicted nucleotide-binding protein